MCPVDRNIPFLNLYKNIRPLPVILFFYILGIILGKSFQPPLVYLYFLILTLLLFSIVGFKKHWSIVNALLFFTILLIGLLNYHLHYQPLGSQNIINFIDNTNLTIIGTVLEKEEYPGQEKYSLHLKIKEIEKKGEKVQASGITLVNVYLKDCPFQYGDILRIKGKISPPYLQGNFGEFDYRLYLAQRRIFTVVNVWQEQKISKIGTENINQLFSISVKIRDRLKKITNQLINSPYNSLLIGILLGERNGLSPEVKDTFIESGIMHILAVSGLHVGIIVAALSLLFKFLSLPRPLKAVLLLLSLIFYSSLSGFRPSVLRAALMFSLLVIGNLLNRQRNIYLSLFFSAWLILLFNPLLIYDAGFLLSFTVTFFILYFPPILQEVLSRINPLIRNPLSLSIAAWIGIFPLSAYYFYKISLIGIIANLFIIPLVGIAVVTGLLIFVIGLIYLPLASLLANIESYILMSINLLAQKFSSLPFAYLHIQQPSILIIFLFYLLIFYIIEIAYPRMCSLHIKNRNILVILLITLVIVFVQLSYPSKDLQVSFINVGEGDCILVETPQGKNILIDGGGTPFSDFDVGNKIVVPYLQRKGINRINLMILTHPDLDHLEGLIAVAKELKIDAFLDNGAGGNLPEYRELIGLVKEKNIPYYQLTAGDQIILNKDLEMLILNPAYNSYFYDKSDLNNSSIVIKLFYKNAKFFFTGDIEEEAEKEMLSSPYNLESDILKIAHHGSISSTSPEFLERVNPKIAIISAGSSNFNHPNPIVIQRLEEKRIKIYRTDQNGTILTKTDGQIYKLNTLR